jgi:hypothetical protein
MLGNGGNNETGRVCRWDDFTAHSDVAEELRKCAGRVCRWDDFTAHSDVAEELRKCAVT